MTRRAEIARETAEVTIRGHLELDGTGASDVKTGLGFLDHMLATLAKHARFDLTLSATGDTEVDDHHTVEDCAIVLGRALDQALGDRAGISRFGFAYAPLDESMSRTVVDLSGRPWPEISIDFSRDTIGDVATENLLHFLRSFAIEGRMALHVDLLRGDNDHHKAESAFKSVAMALRSAVGADGAGVPSTKGTLT
jgi:imidazoleglycerol phosphate dehydratase HisB